MQKEKLTAMLDVVRLRSMGITRSHDEISAAINPQRANAVAKR
jgi:hypothetical protein